MKAIVLVCALAALLALASAQSCKSYERTHAACNPGAGACCQKGLECRGGACEVPQQSGATTAPGTAKPPQQSGATTAPGTAKPPTSGASTLPAPAPASCKSYERTHAACNPGTGACCQKGLECRAGACEVPQGK